MVRNIRMVVAVAAALIALPAMGKPIAIIRGRIVEDVTGTPIPDANVRLYFVCPKPFGESPPPIASTSTQGTGTYEMKVDLESQPVCLNSDSTTHMRGKKDLVLSAPETNAGDLPLRPLAKGVINYVALFDLIVARKRMSDPNAQAYFTKVLVSSATEKNENWRSVMEMYVKNREFRFFVDDGCERNKELCKPIEVDLAKWKVALVAHEKGLKDLQSPP